MTISSLTKFRLEVRTAVANYMASEGCSCCQNLEAHKKHKEALAKLLKVEPYEDNSGFNFSSYESKE